MRGPHIHIPYAVVGEHLPFIREHRLNLELFFSADVLDIASPAEIAGLIDRLDYGPQLSLHAPFMDLSPGAVDSRVREVTRLRFRQVMDVAAALGPRSVVFHSGYEKWKYALDAGLWLRQSLPVWNEVVERAAEIGTVVAVENIFEDTPDNLRMLIESIGSPSFGLCFDTGHFNLFSRVGLEEWIAGTGDRIVELHLHDNDGTRDAHRPPGSGTFDFRLLFSLLRGRQGLIPTIEAHSREEVAESISALSELLTISPSF